MNNKAKELNEKIKELSEVKIYLEIKKEIANNKEIMALYEEIHNLQLELKKVAATNMNEYKKIQKNLENKKQQFINHPLIANYYRYREDTLTIIEQLNQILK